MFLFLDGNTSIDSIVNNIVSSQVIESKKPWLVPVYWSPVFDSLTDAEQKQFRKFNGFAFEVAHFNFAEIVESASLLDFCNTEIIGCSFTDFKKNMNTLVRALVNELGAHFWNNQNLDSSFRAMESSEVNDLIAGLKLAFPNLSTRYREFFQLFAQENDLGCKVTKSTFKPTFNVCILKL